MIRFRKFIMVKDWLWQIFYIDKYYMCDGEKCVGIFGFLLNIYLINLDYEKD